MTIGTYVVPMCALLDRVLRERLAEIIQRLGIRTVVETGVDRGGSSLLFAQIVGQYIGVDNNPKAIETASALLAKYGVTNATLHTMNSPTALRQLVADDIDATTTLFLLDAHWQAYWPLLDEIHAIPRGQGVLVMHDVVVPGCPRLGFDEYDGQRLDYPYVKAALDAWSPEHVIEYNDHTAEIPTRGVMIVYPNAELRDRASR